jgi:hypothetical protein
MIIVRLQIVVSREVALGRRPGVLATHITGATRGRKRNPDSSANRQMASVACGGLMGRLISPASAGSPGRGRKQRFGTGLRRAMPRSSCRGRCKVAFA